jgi:hypothetical protein
LSWYLLYQGENDMKKVWKWVLGIVIGLVVLAALAFGAFMMRGHFGNMAYITRYNQPGIQVPGKENGGRVPGPFYGNRSFDNRGWGGRGMHMVGPGMMGVGRRMPFGGFFGGLICLGFLALVVLGIIWLVRRLRKPAAVSAPAPVVSVPAVDAAPVAAPSASEPVVSAVKPCPKCGEPVQEGWKHCPNCGKRL